MTLDASIAATLEPYQVIVPFTTDTTVMTLNTSIAATLEPCECDSEG